MAGQMGFLLDAMLGRLSRWLRVMGCDAELWPQACRRRHCRATTTTEALTLPGLSLPQARVAAADTQALLKAAAGAVACSVHAVAWPVNAAR